MSRAERSFVLWGGVALTVCVVAAGLPRAASAADAKAQAQEALEATGVKGGLIVHVGCGAGKLTAALRANDGCLVHGLGRDPANVARAREQLRVSGLYGPVALDTFDGKHLPYAENLVNLLVAQDPGQVPMDEVMRVLCPRGVWWRRAAACTSPSAIEPRSPYWTPPQAKSCGS